MNSLHSLQTKVQTLQDTLTALTAELEQLKANQSNKHTGIMWELTATSTEVILITGGKYDWQPLRKYCIEAGFEIPKKDYYGLMMNNYPAQAWLDVYGVDLCHLFPWRVEDLQK